MPGLAVVHDSHQSSRLAEFGGLGMSFNICRGTLGSLAMFTAMRNASSRVQRVNSSRGARCCVSCDAHAAPADFIVYPSGGVFGAQRRRLLLVEV